MFNKIKFAVTGTVLAAALASTSAYAATETADATVNVLGPIVLVVDEALDFGTIAPTAVSGTVVVGTATDVATCTNVVCVAGTAKRGEFHVDYAVDGAVVEISTGNVVDLDDGAGNTMALTALTMSDGDGEITFDAAADEAVYVGGSLAVAANQAAGVYTGSFDVIANYQ